MADAAKPEQAPRPWTPTERPGDTSHAVSVVYHGDHNVESESDSESEESEVNTKRPSKTPPSPDGIEVDSRGTSKDVSKPKMLSSATLEENAKSTSQTPTYTAYMGKPTEAPAVETAAANAQQKIERRPVQRSQPQPRPVSRQNSSDSENALPSVTGKSYKQIKILLINPNSTESMTDQCLESVTDTIPSDVTVYGFTPAHPAPTAIESSTDAILSTAACIREVLPIAAKYDAFLVACFSHHPLIAALREQLSQPVIGIMEAGLYASRMCSSKFGVLTTGVRSMYKIEESIKHEYGLGPFSVGCEASRLGVLELESLPQEVVQDRLAATATKLQARGADSIVLGCAGMTDLKEACEHAVGMHDRAAMVIDGVAMGVHFLTALVREGLGTAKGRAYNTGSGYKVVSKPKP